MLSNEWSFASVAMGIGSSSGSGREAQIKSRTEAPRTDAEKERMEKEKEKEKKKKPKRAQDGPASPKRASDGPASPKSPAGNAAKKKNNKGSLARIKKTMLTKLDNALINCDSNDNALLNKLLDHALTSKIISGTDVVKRAANQVAARQLAEAIASDSPKQLKGALVVSNRLLATELPEFAAAVKRYQEVRKLPRGWDVHKMVLHREGIKMVAKMKVNSPKVMSHFQRLLDLTYRRVYTRDRKGESMPDRMELVAVSAVTNDDMWADYMARREDIRQELEEDKESFVEFSATVETLAPFQDGSPEGLTLCVGPSAEEIARTLAEDFAEPLLSCVNEVFLLHGTTADAAERIGSSAFRINLAGSNTGTLYGRGLYLSENSTKSDEYTKPLDNGDRHLILCRCVLGRAHYVDGKDPDPRECEDSCVRGKFHSVLGDRRKCRGTFREFVIFDEEQVYPNYIITYRRVLPGVQNTVRKMMVTCPPIGRPGQLMQFLSPEKWTLQIEIPPGTEPGQQILVQY